MNESGSSIFLLASTNFRARMAWPSLLPRALRSLPLPLLLLATLPLLSAAPYSCQVDGDIHRPRHDFNISMVVGVKGFAPAFVTLYQSKEQGAEGDVGVTYQVTLTDRFYARIDREEAGARLELAKVQAPKALLSADEVHYFWVRATPGVVNGTIELGRAGSTEPFLRASDSSFVQPVGIRFRSNSFWLHSCSPAAVEPTPLGCRQLTSTHRYDFLESFDLRSEEVPLGAKSPILGEAKAIRFMVRGSRDAYVRLKGTPAKVHYEIDLNFVNKISIQKLATYLNQTTCNSCLSAHEFRLYTMVYNKTRLELYEGAELVAPRVAVNLVNFVIGSVSFSSMSSAGSVLWLHACQGYAPSLFARDTTEAPASLPVPLPAPLSPEARSAALNSSELAGCRMVNTFKYRFDGYFSLSDEGFVSGSTSVLPFRVLGRKDIHIQLVSAIPPLSDDIYEIDMDFYNHTNLDRGKESKVASVQHANLLSATELRGFVLVHDAVTGVLNITTEDGRPILVWRDPKPFPLRYFSICSGSSAGNDTTWVFGCPGYPKTRPETERVKSGCSRPLLTYTYSHSQYFNMAREGVVSGSQRTIHLYLHAKGSGHVRLESALPPAVDALFEVDLYHEGNTSIDSLGKRVASVAVPGLLGLGELRGFWLRQDLAARRLDVGVEGHVEPLVSYTAPPNVKFPEVRLFSLATSRSAGNGTWYYGCHDGRRPSEEPFVAVAEQVFDHDDETDVVFGEGDALFPDPPTDPDAASPPWASDPESQVARHFLHASKALYLHFRLIDHQPADGTPINVTLNVTKVYLDDVSGAAVVRGHLCAKWADENIKWEPKDYDNIENVNNVDLGWMWTPEFTAHHGDLKMGGLVHLDHTGLARWEASLDVQSHCAMRARAWPHDQHECMIDIAIAESGGHYLRLAADKYNYKHDSPQDWVESGAAAPFWQLLSLRVVLLDEHANATTGTVTTAGGATTLRIVLSARRTTPVLHHILLAPFVALAAMCLLAYWVREPLPRDKTILGCGALLLLVLSFLVLEAACPPGLMGMPAIVEVYCWCVCAVALSVGVCAILAAVSRDRPLRSPPALLCAVLASPLVRWALMLQVDLAPDDELRPDAVDYKKGSTQVYLRFDHGGGEDCKCGKRTCSKQVAVEARYYWTLLVMASERVFSIMCFALLLIAAVLMHSK